MDFYIIKRGNTDKEIKWLEEASLTTSLFKFCNIFFWIKLILQYVFAQQYIYQHIFHFQNSNYM